MSHAHAFLRFDFTPPLPADAKRKRTMPTIAVSVGFGPGPYDEARTAEAAIWLRERGRAILARKGA